MTWLRAVSQPARRWHRPRLAGWLISEITFFLSGRQATTGHLSGQPSQATSISGHNRPQGFDVIVKGHDIISGHLSISPWLRGTIDHILWHGISWSHSRHTCTFHHAYGIKLYIFFNYWCFIPLRVNLSSLIPHITKFDNIPISFEPHAQ